MPTGVEEIGEPLRDSTIPFGLEMSDETPDDVMHSVCDPELPDAGLRHCVAKCIAQFESKDSTAGKPSNGVACTLE